MDLDLRHKDFLRGLMIMVGGVALLLHTFGFLQRGINVILIFVSIAAIAYGLVKSGMYDSVRKLTHKKK